MDNILRFENPDYLYGLIVIPLLIIIYLLVRIRQEKVFKRFADKAMFSYLAPQRSGRRSIVRFVVFLLMIACFIVGLANLQSGSKMEEVKREGIDLYIAVDVSNSMNAQDIVPSRLDRSKQAINTLIGKLCGDRLGVIIFADKAFVQLPVTTDYAAAKMFLASVNSTSVASQGTAIGEAIELAVKSFADDTRSQAIIIISDGEDHENEEALKAAREAAKKGIKIYTIGMGLPEGAPIPMYNQRGQMIGYKKDKSGNTVITRLDENMLRSIAEAGGGAYARANNSNVGLDDIYNEISKLDKTEIETQVFTDYEDRYQWFVGPGILLLLVWIFLSSGKRAWEKKLNIFERKGE